MAAVYSRFYKIVTIVYMPIFNISFYGKAQSIGESPNPLRLILILLLQPKTAPPKETIAYICGLRARIECEHGSEHSTHSDRVTNIGYCLFRGASPLPAANQNLIINVDITLRIVKSIFITAINPSLFIKGIRQFSFEQSVSEWNFLKENRIRTGFSIIA